VGAVYARSTMFDAKADSIDVGIAFCRDEVMPQLTATPGCVGFSLVVDRASGRCIATSSWDAQDSMRASAASVAPIRARGVEAFSSGEPEVQEWDIGLLHRNHQTSQGSCARLVWVRGSASAQDRMLDTIKLVTLPQLDQLEGFCSMSVMFDRASGLCCVTTSYDDQRTLEASRDKAKGFRETVVGETGQEIFRVDECEIAIAHLHVPETV